MRLPCLNILKGGMIFHGVYELITLEHMEKSSQVILEIFRLNEKAN